MRAHEGYRELEKASPDRHRVRARLLRQESSDRSMARYAVAPTPARHSCRFNRDWEYLKEKLPAPSLAVASARRGDGSSK